MANNAEPALTGARMVQAGDFDLELAPSVVLVYDQSLVPSRSSKRRHRSSTHPFRAVGSLSTAVDIVATVGPGSPVAAVTVEFLAAFGVRQIATVGVAGSLHGKPTQSHYVIERAESDEGTSVHYGANLRADRELTESLVSELGTATAVTLTTDVPFRHTPARLESHRQRATLVEMECAAVFAAANHFGLRAASVLVVSDVFGPAGWQQQQNANTPALLRHVVTAAGNVLQSA